MIHNSIQRALSDERGFGLVEAMIAMTILVIGLLAVSGLTLATAAQATIADVRSDQMMAGKMVVEELRAQDFDTVVTTVDTVTTSGRTFYVTSTVTVLSKRARQVTVDVAPSTPGLVARSFTTVLHDPRSLPAAP